MNRIEQKKNDPDKIELMNKVRELLKTNTGLAKHEDKLEQLNGFQYVGLVKESLEPIEAFRQEIEEREVEITNYKKKHKQLTQI